MKQFLVLLSINFILSSCVKEKQTFTDLKIKNSTAHSVEIIPYRHGDIYSEVIINIREYSDTMIKKNYFHRGISNIPLFFPEYLNDTDSAKVIFDNQFSITHYFKQTSMVSEKYYEKLSNRNLSNLDSYNSFIESESKNTRHWISIYTFTEQDYLDAKP